MYTGPSTTILHSPEELASFRRQHEIAFLLGLPTEAQEKGETHAIRQAFLNVAESLKHVAYFAIAEFEGLESAGYR